MSLLVSISLIGIHTARASAIDARTQDFRNAVERGLNDVDIVFLYSRNHIPDRTQFGHTVYHSGYTALRAIIKDEVHTIVHETNSFIVIPNGPTKGLATGTTKEWVWTLDPGHDVLQLSPSIKRPGYWSNSPVNLLDNINYSTASEIARMGVRHAEWSDISWPTANTATGSSPTHGLFNGHIKERDDTGRVTKFEYSWSVLSNENTTINYKYNDFTNVLPSIMWTLSTASNQSLTNIVVSLKFITNIDVATIALPHNFRACP